MSINIYEKFKNEIYIIKKRLHSTIFEIIHFKNDISKIEYPTNLQFKKQPDITNWYYEDPMLYGQINDSISKQREEYRSNYYKEYAYPENVQNLYYLFFSTIHLLGLLLTFNKEILRKGYNKNGVVKKGVVKQLFDNVTKNNLFSELENDYLNFIRKTELKDHYREELFRIRYIKERFTEITEISNKPNVSLFNYFKNRFLTINSSSDDSSSDSSSEDESSEDESSENESLENESLETKNIEIEKIAKIFEKLFEFYNNIYNVVEKEKKQNNNYGGKKKTRGKKKTKKNTKKSQRNRKS